MIIKFDFNRLEVTLIDRFMEAIDANKKRIQLAYKRRRENSLNLQTVTANKNTMQITGSETEKRRGHS